MSFVDKLESELGEFNSLKCNAVSLIEIRSSSIEPRLSLSFLVRYGTEREILFNLTSVKKLKLPPMSGASLEFGELLINPLSPEHPEAPGWQWHDDLWGFSCYCEKVSAEVREFEIGNEV